MLKIHGEIFSISSLREDIDHVIIFRQIFCVFKMAMFARVANQFSRKF